MMTDNLEATGTDHNLLFIDQVCIDQSNVHERNREYNRHSLLPSKLNRPFHCGVHCIARRTLFANARSQLGNTKRSMDQIPNHVY
jgi:hypothetical protein